MAELAAAAARTRAGTRRGRARAGVGSRGRSSDVDAVGECGTRARVWWWRRGRAARSALAAADTSEKLASGRPDFFAISEKSSKTLSVNVPSR